ncbi:MAG: type II TA system antitoxin MqsA family protein [Elusimicrobiales bacterium]
MKTYCPNCDKMVPAVEHTKAEKLPVKGDEIEIKSVFLRCPECSESIFNEKLDSKNLEQAFAGYRRKHKLLSPREIRAIREQYGLSQRAFGGLLGWGEITIHRYEAGAIQDRAHNELLELIKMPENMLFIYEENKELLPQRLRDEIHIKVNVLMERAAVSRFNKAFEYYLSYAKTAQPEFTGNKAFDLRKTIQMILYIVNHLKETFKTKINKMLWYADFLHFKRHMISISGNGYVHLDFGPVPNHYDLILSKMVEDKLLRKEERKFGEAISALVTPNAREFTETEKEALDFVIGKFKNSSCNEISQQSHNESPYKNTATRERISYHLAKNLTMSLP